MGERRRLERTIFLDLDTLERKQDRRIGILMAIATLIGVSIGLFAFFHN